MYGFFEGIHLRGRFICELHDKHLSWSVMSVEWGGETE